MIMGMRKGGLSTEVARKDVSHQWHKLLSSVSEQNPKLSPVLHHVQVQQNASKQKKRKQGDVLERTVDKTGVEQNSFQSGGQGRKGGRSGVRGRREKSEDEHDGVQQKRHAHVLDDRVLQSFVCPRDAVVAA